MTDVTKALAAKSDQLNADDLVTGPRTIKVREVKVQSTPEQPIWVYYEGDNGKPWKPCKTAGRCLAAIWGSNSAQWVGLSCTIYNDPTVTWAGMAVGGIRVSHMEGIDKPRALSLAKTRGKKDVVTIQPLRVVADTVTKPDAASAPVADLTKARQAAGNGTEALREWWKGASPDDRAAATAAMDELKAIAAAADAAAVPDDELPM